jgi:crotonobetainyl-CoA:carnitine CoA-transferase CaiB-like acyl-CoA transferase
MTPEGRSLEGIVVADFSRILAGPLATMILGDLGATVIKVERPGSGDDTRQWGPPWNAGTSTYYQGLNRNKRSIALELSNAEDAETARRLARRADVLVENFRPGTMARWGLDYPDIAARNPALVYCSISGFGSEGPGAALPGYDLLAQAMGGMMSITGPADGPPSKAGVALIDKISGLYAATGILAALHHARATGEGQQIEIALIDTALAALLNVASGYLNAGVDGGLHGNRHPSIAPYQTYRAADREFVLAVGSDRQWQMTCALIDRPDLAADPAFATNNDRVANIDRLEEELEQTLTTRSATEWVSIFRDAGIPAGPVNAVSDAFAFAAEIGRQAVVETPSGSGTFRSTRSPIRMSDTPPAVRMAPPEVGEHSDEILAWLASGAPDAEPS